MVMMLPISANANARAHRNPSKSRVGQGLFPASSTAWAPCLGKRRAQAHGGSHALTPGPRVNSPCPGAVTLLLLILAWPKMKSTFQQQEGSPAPFQLPCPSSMGWICAELWWYLPREVWWNLCFCWLYRQSRPYFSRNLLCFNTLKSTCTSIRGKGSFH